MSTISGTRVTTPRNDTIIFTNLSRVDEDIGNVATTSHLGASPEFDKVER